MTNEFENEEIISQFVGIINGCEQSGDRVFKNDNKKGCQKILAADIVLYWCHVIPICQVVLKYYPYKSEMDPAVVAWR